MNRELVISGFYRHFKNKIYQVKAIAYDSETKEKQVVYQAMYGTYDYYVRPLDMFMSEVDHVKYPEVTQKYRFEQIEILDEKPVESTKAVEDNDEVVVKTQDAGMIQDEEEGQLDKRLLQFLDAEDYTEKLKVLTLYRDNMDDKLIDAMAVSVDAEVNEGSLEERYMSLKSFVAAHAKYECNRLR